MPGASSSARARLSARLSDLRGSLLGTTGATRPDDDTTRGTELVRLAGDEREQREKKRTEKKESKKAEESKSAGRDDVERGRGRGAPDGSSPDPSASARTKRSSAKSSHSATSTSGRSVDSGAEEQPFYLKKRFLVPSGVVGACLLLWLGYLFVSIFTGKKEAAGLPGGAAAGSASAPPAAGGAAGPAPPKSKRPSAPAAGTKGAPAGDSALTTQAAELPGGATAGPAAGAPTTAGALTTAGAPTTAQTTGGQAAGSSGGAAAGQTSAPPAAGVPALPTPEARCWAPTKDDVVGAEPTLRVTADPVWPKWYTDILKKGKPGALPEWPPTLREVELPNFAGSLFLRSMPGMGEEWQTFLGQVDEAKVNAIVCLPPRWEVTRLSPVYAAALNSAEPRRVEVLDQLSIEDFSVPADREAFLKLVLEIAERIKKGQNVMIHCRGGRGRTGTVAVSVLVALGFDQQGAKEKVRKAKAHPETDDQLELVNWVAERIKPQATGGS